MEPYDNSHEHLRDELERLDLLLRRHLEEWWRDRDGTSDEFRGLYVSDEEVDQLLTVAPGDGLRDSESRSETNVEHGDPVLSDSRIRTQSDSRSRTHQGDTEGPSGLEKRITDCARRIHSRKTATAAIASKLRLVTLAERFDLEPRHVDALLVVLAPELDRKYATIYGYLRDDVTKSRPTVGLILDILCRSETERLAARSVFNRTSSLIDNHLVRLAGDERIPSQSHEVVVEERIVEFLLENDDIAAELAHVATVQSLEASIEDLLIDDETARTLKTLKGDLADGSGRQMIYVYGPYGVGKAAAVEALCAAAELSLLYVDAGVFLESDLRTAVRLLAREAKLQGAALHVDLVPLPEDAEVDLEDILQALDEIDEHIFVSGTESLATHRPKGVKNHGFATVHLPMPTYERRRERWGDIDTLPETVDPAKLAAMFRLTDGQIDDAVAVAEMLSDAEELDRDAVYEACRSQSTDDLGSLARKIDPHYTWDDIVLPPEAMTRLREIAAHITNQGRVYTDWGFADKFSHGNGLVVLFNGPSGTGKTMAADIIAGATGLDLYKIDLANVVSKYIGETEKNLGRIFDEAEDSSAILFFDEADALFGERTEVGDAHDRYANIEVNYLLQRVEEHDGTVILTTNLEGNIDDAFRRRIHLRLDFPFPDRDSREAIWRSVFPDDTPVGQLDIEFLSSLEITGGNIKNIALTAAFLAADDSSRVEMDHVVAATKQEFRKMGKLVSPEEFEEYQATAHHGEER